MKRKISIWMTGVVIVLLLLVAIDFINNEHLEKSGTVTVKSDRWNSIISKEINNRNISVYVDGKLYNDTENKFFINDKLVLMIPVDDISSIFNCAQNLYFQNKLVVEKGTTKVTMALNSVEVNVNDKKYRPEYSLAKIDDTVYVPVNVFTEYFGYSYNWDGQKYMATLIDENADERKVPYRYSYEEEDKSPKVRSQGNFGTCWAFASLTALESSLRPEEEKVFSVDHMALFNSYSGGMNEGGDYTMSMAYLTAWQGPVLESEDPYDGVSDESYKVAKHIQEIQIINSKNFEEIKEMVYRYGGVQSSLYTSLINSQSVSSFYNDENFSYCYIGENKPNHDVVIIGWDDNYPKENFNVDVEGDGAFICRSSWGEDFGDDGNFYVSYYDSNIGVHNIVYTVIEDTDNYDNIYQTDLCGWVGNMGYKGKNTAYFANVYTSKGDESLEAVGFYATDKDAEYEVYVCSDFQGADSLSTDRVMAASGTLSNQGYYTVKLNDEFSFNKGQKYAVIVKATTPNSTKPIAVEFVNDERTKTVTIDDGEGYISLKGTSWENVEKSKACNICLKAFTTND